MVVACIALVGAWGGPALADAFITGRDVKNRSLTGKDMKSRSIPGRAIKSNTITGRNVKNLSGRDIAQDSLDGFNIFEKGLGQVPTAGRADSAATADRASRLDTADPTASARALRAIANLAAGSEHAVLEAGGLRVLVRCNAAGQIEATATTSATSGAAIRTSVIRGSQGAAYAGDDDFRPGDTFNLLPSGRPNVSGHLHYATVDGTLVDLDFSADDGTSALTPNGGCSFAGQGIQSGSD